MAASPVIRTGQQPGGKRIRILMDTGVMAPSYDVLRTFLAVYRSASVTRAAELLGLSQHPAATAVRGHLLAQGRTWQG